MTASTTNLTLTRIAHSTTLINIGGRIILTDPWFSEKWGYYHGEPYGLTLDQLPRLAAVIVSHGHYDHYDMQAFQAYPDKSVPIRQARHRQGRTRGGLHQRYGDGRLGDRDHRPTDADRRAGQTRCTGDHVHHQRRRLHGLFRRRHAAYP